VAARIVTFKLDEELLALLDEAARRLGFQHRSELIREAIKQYLERHGVVVPVPRERVDPRSVGLEIEV